MRKNAVKETVNCIAMLTFIGAALALFIMALFTIKPWIPIAVTCGVIGVSFIIMGMTNNHMNFTVDDDLFDGEEY